MGFDIYFYKFDPRGEDNVDYQGWFGDVHTEIEIKEYYDFELFQYIYPQYDLKEYHMSSMCGDGTLGFTNNTGNYIEIDSTIVPVKRKVGKIVPVTEVNYFRLGYGGYLLGDCEPDEINIGDMWRDLEKYVMQGDPNAMPYMAKDAFVNMLKLPEFKPLAIRIKGSKIDANTVDFDMVYLSW